MPFITGFFNKDLQYRGKWSDYVNPKEIKIFHTFDDPYTYEEFVRLVEFKENREAGYYAEKKNREEYLKRRYDNVLRAEKIDHHMDYDRLLSYYRIPFGKLDLIKIKDLFSHFTSLRSHCSAMICDLLQAG